MLVLQFPSPVSLLIIFQAEQSSSYYHNFTLFNHKEIFIFILARKLEESANNKVDLVEVKIVGERLKKFRVFDLELAELDLNLVNKLRLFLVQ